MTRNITILIPLLLVVACKKADDALPPAHATCQTLDDRGVDDRLDGVTSNKQDVFALDGHCLEATSVITYGDVVGVRFSPATSDGDGVPFYIQMFMVPPDGDQELIVQAPDRLSNPDCVGVEPGFLCGHIDDVVNTPNIDVDLRGKAGTLDLELINTTGAGLRNYEGDLEWTIWGVDSTGTPDVYDEPSVLMAGTVHLTRL